MSFPCERSTPCQPNGVFFAVRYSDVMLTAMAVVIVLATAAAWGMYPFWSAHEEIAFVCLAEAPLFWCVAVLAGVCNSLVERTYEGANSPLVPGDRQDSGISPGLRWVLWRLGPNLLCCGALELLYALSR
jgi:hypothetical protein